jgi:hypothetical protein
MSPQLDPVAEAKNAKTVIARMSGQERCLYVYAKMAGKNGAMAYIFLGSLPFMTDKTQIAAECKRQWPAQFAWKDGIRVKEHP